MESFNNGDKPKFGHLTCKILDNIPADKFKNDIDTNSVNKKLEMLKERRHYRPLYYQVMKTMYATILFKAADPETKFDSIDYLLEVLDEDETNITALADLAFIYNHMVDVKRANDYQSKFAEIMNSNNHLALPRAFYDRAHIIRHFEQDKRKFTYFELLKESKYHIGKVDNNDDNIETERGEILFHYSLSLYRKYSQKTEFGILEETEIERSDELLEMTIDSFLDVINISQSPYDCKALSYIFIAILLRLKTSFDKYIETQSNYVNQHLADLNLDMHACLEKGLKLAEEDANVLRRVASEYTHLNRIEEAEVFFKKSLLKEESWFAYSHQGRLYLKMYNGTKDDEYLSKAKCSFKRAYRIKQTHADLSDIGYVFLLRGERMLLENPDDTDARKLIDKAKLTFADAVKLTNSDDYCNPIETYKRWGRCLQLTDEDRGLILVRKMSEDRAELLTPDALHDLSSEVNLVWKDDSSSEVAVTEQRTSEVMSIKYSSPLTTNKHDFYIITSQVDRQWVVRQLLPKLEGEYKLTGFLNGRDNNLGDDFINSMVEAIQSSRFIIVVLSPNSLTCQWCSYELSLALNNALLRLPKYNVLPIMLEECAIPDKLNPFCEGTRLITSVDGKIDEQDWLQLQQAFVKT